MNDKENQKYWENHGFECRKLYKTLYEKGLSQQQVQDMAKWFYSMINKPSLTDCSIEQIQQFQDFANMMSTTQFDALENLLIIWREHDQIT